MQTSIPLLNRSRNMWSASNKLGRHVNEIMWFQYQSITFNSDFNYHY